MPECASAASNAPEPAVEATTDDALRGGRIAYRQPAKGYRVGVEAPLLAAFALPPGRRPPRAVVDLGAGAGAVGLCIAMSVPESRVTLVEREPLAAQLARENVAKNGFKMRVCVVEGELGTQGAELERGGFDLVVSNPPWFDEHAGAPSPDPRRRAARQLAPDALESLALTARQLLGRRARLCVTFPASSVARLLDVLAGQGLVAKRMRMLHPRATEPATAAFVEARAARPGGLVVEAPWFLRGPGEAYTDELRALLW
jgi:tRNA1(Val) A37 N6-methylase TrmN6